MLGLIAVCWGFFGLAFILGNAIVRLGSIGLDSLAYPFDWYHWLGLVACVIFMGIFEGYRGFQCAYSPRVAARLLYLKDNVTPLRLILAPFFCMGLFDIQRRRMIVSYCLLAGILVMVQLVHMLNQPWRGIVDIGVVFGLAWGLVSIVAFVWQAFFGQGFRHSPEMP